LREWAVLQLKSDDRRFLIGLRSSPRLPEIAGPIQSFNPKARAFRTADGQDFEVLDLGLVSVDARRAWRHWCRENGEPGFTEVTEEYEDAINAER